MKNKVLIVFIIIFLLSSCAQSNEKIKNKSNVETKKTSASEGEETTSLIENSSADNTEAKVEDVEIEEFTLSTGENGGQIIDLKKKVLISDEKVEVKLLNLDLSHYPQADLGPTFRLSVENKSDEIIFVGIEEVSINAVNMPTVYEEIRVQYKESMNDILPIAKNRFLEKIVKMGEIGSINVSFYIRNKDNTYYEHLENLTFNGLGKNEIYDFKKLGLAPKYDLGEQVAILDEYIYDNGVELVIPFAYNAKDFTRVLVPKTAVINEEKDLKCVGYQKAVKGVRGFGEAFINKEELSDIDLSEIEKIELKISVKNEAGGDSGSLSLSSDNIKFID